MPSPAAAFQRTSQRSRSSASRSEHPSSACRTITTAITDPGTDGRPRGPKRSSNNPSGNNLRRFSAKNRCTDPSRTRPPHKPKVSNSSRSSFSVPCIPHDPTPHTRSRAPRPELLSTLLERHNIKKYDLICTHIGRILPVFDRFDIEESYGRVQLRWRAKGTDRTFGAHLTSDGSLRFFALVTLLNLPPEMMPDVILLDEPELGLHPAAINLVGNMIQSVSAQRQAIIATQSPLLVDCFDLDGVVVLDLHDDATVLRRLDRQQFERWLDDFTTGELWQQNLLGGRP